MGPKPAKTFGAPTTANKPPKFELEGRKWTVEFHKNNPNMEIDNPETNQSVYVYKCEGSTLKVNGKVNNIVVDGCKKFLSKESLDTEIITAKSSEMNVLIPTTTAEGDEFVEQPVPEQFKTKVNGVKLVTHVTESV